MEDIEKVKKDEEIVAGKEGVDEVGKKVQGVDEVGKKVQGVDEVGKKVEGVDEVGRKVEGVDEVGRKVEGVDEVGRKNEGVDVVDAVKNLNINATVPAITDETTTASTDAINAAQAAVTSSEPTCATIESTAAESTVADITAETDAKTSDAIAEIQEDKDLKICKEETKLQEAQEIEKPIEKMADEKKEDEKKVTKETKVEKKIPEDKKGNFLRQFRSGSSGFKKFTASQFMQVWNHFDTDGNGYIEDHELDGFLKEFVLSSCREGESRPEVLSDSAMALFRETFMDAFDENQDGMIDISELAEILPTDENFLLLFHLKNPLESSVEFMKIWRKFDKDCKGYIVTSELGPFLKHMLETQKTVVSDEKLIEYTETILNLFDSNRDGKLQLAEMSRLMPVKHNLLSKPFLKGASCITRRDIDRLFKIYDQNNNGSIEDEELSGLLKDLMDLGKKDATLEDIEKMKAALMEHWDVDGDGSISKSELRMFLIQHCKMLAETQGIKYEDESDDDDDD